MQQEAAGYERYLAGLGRGGGPGNPDPHHREPGTVPAPGWTRQSARRNGSAIVT